MSGHYGLGRALSLLSKLLSGRANSWPSRLVLLSPHTEPFQRWGTPFSACTLLLAFPCQTGITVVHYSDYCIKLVPGTRRPAEVVSFFVRNRMKRSRPKLEYDSCCTPNRSLARQKTNSPHSPPQVPWLFETRFSYPRSLLPPLICGALLSGL